MNTRVKTFEQWKKMASSLLEIEGRAFIDGHYVDALSRRTFAVISPIDGQVIASVANCGQADVDMAVAVAQRAHESGVWSLYSPTQRKQVLLRLAQLLTQDMDQFALLESLDMGKPISDSLGDMLGAVEAIAYYAEAVDKVHDLIAPTASQYHGMITREPIGVVAAITPWNDPLMIATWKIAPALAMGNTVVFKPSEKSSLTAIRFALLARQAGLPDGVLNVVPGGAEVGKALALHPQVRALTFTGSSKVAKQLQVYSGESNLKRMFLEGGGKNAHIVFADTPDLAKAAKAAAKGFCWNQGAICASGTRLLLERPIKERFVELLLQEAQAWQPGHPLDPSTTSGAIVDEAHLASVQRYVDTVEPEGGRIIAGGKRALEHTGGTYYEPTVIDDATPEMTTSQEEIFGPVVSLMSFDDEQEAIEVANATEYGLTAGLWTPTAARIHRVARQLQAGTVWVNCYETTDFLYPFGGYKQSGIGKDRSIHAMAQYTELKSTWIDLEEGS